MIITEDGTGLPDANAYECTANADAFHLVRKNTEWAFAILDDRERALVIATDYIEQHYQAFSTPLSTDQALQWPRQTGGVPRAVRNATMMLALNVLKGPLIAPAQRGIKSTSKTVGKLSVETVYDDPNIAADPYPEITGLLSGVASQSGRGGARVVVGRVIR